MRFQFFFSCQIVIKVDVSNVRIFQNNDYKDLVSSGIIVLPLIWSYYLL